MTEYAKGLEGVIANESALSKVEGAEGRLSYLGYSIDSLVCASMIRTPVARFLFGS